LIVWKSNLFKEKKNLYIENTKKGKNIWGQPIHNV